MTGSTTDAAAPLLRIRGLCAEFRSGGRVVPAVRGVDLDVRPGEFLGVVGESGSGKSATVSAALGLLPTWSGRVTGGEVWFDGVDLLRLREREMRRVRGRRIGMIFQDPTSSFNPVRTVGYQIAEAVRVHHRGMSHKDTRARAIALLDMVGVPSARVRADQFPHEFSGGMRQRAMIAMAMANEPDLLIADEPTTALDVTVQAQILDLLTTVRQESGAATILITHDLGLIAELADRVVVMYAGRVVESADVFDAFHRPRHPYTRGLLASLPRMESTATTLTSIPGQPPSTHSAEDGCSFRPRCRLSADRETCRTVEPELRPDGAAHRAACHFAGEWDGLPFLPVGNAGGTAR